MTPEEGDVRKLEELENIYADLLVGPTHDRTLHPRQSLETEPHSRPLFPPRSTINMKHFQNYLSLSAMKVIAENPPPIPHTR